MYFKNILSGKISGASNIMNRYNQADLTSNVRLYLTAIEAAERLGVTDKTLDRWRIEGEGPKFIQVGKKKIGYREIDLIEYIDSNVIDPVNKFDQFS